MVPRARDNNLKTTRESLMRLEDLTSRHANASPTIILLLFRIIVGLAFACRLVRSSNRISDSRVVFRLLSRARGTIWRSASAHESQHVSVPVTVGVLAPTVLLPLSWREWDDRKLDAVIAHEVSHLLRWDPLSQCV